MNFAILRYCNFKYLLNLISIFCEYLSTKNLKYVDRYHQATVWPEIFSKIGGWLNQPCISLPTFNTCMLILPTKVSSLNVAG